VGNFTASPCLDASALLLLSDFFVQSPTSHLEQAPQRETTRKLIVSKRFGSSPLDNGAIMSVTGRPSLSLHFHFFDFSGKSKSGTRPVVAFPSNSLNSTDSAQLFT
jgi:hypothetical protein